MPSSLLLTERNRLLCALPQHERQRLLLSGETVAIHVGEVLFEAYQPIRHLYFPLSGFISHSYHSSDRRSIELGLTGYEGMLGATVILGVDTAPANAVVKADGEALRIDIRHMQQLALTCPTLLSIIKRYLYVLLAQLMCNATCGHYHGVEQRLARWLLTVQDCAQSEHLQLTHSDLAGMLGVRRSAISIAAGLLKTRHLVQYKRGHITIINRQALEQETCKCYAILKSEYARQLEHIENSE
ncbi:MAG: Crp/Fnr family transcriptional regulator [Gammaproteobacteria bacterium HGW-Gammaproteobacteria-12]|nr:MAG: Crp/Fnr family transcriptional regulator [Gammaproteobacteria bacterium HGW-Gammaproteobacteria-12]